MSKKKALKHWCKDYQGNGMEACKTCGLSFTAHSMSKTTFKTFTQTLEEEAREIVNCFARYGTLEVGRRLEVEEAVMEIMNLIKKQSKQYEARIRVHQSLFKNLKEI